MKIALLGYGKMGKVIERIALERGHEIVLKKDHDNTFEGLLNADVAIDFSVPDSAVGNISECLNISIDEIISFLGILHKRLTNNTIIKTIKSQKTKAILLLVNCIKLKR